MGLFLNDVNGFLEKKKKTFFFWLVERIPSKI